MARPPRIYRFAILLAATIFLSGCSASSAFLDTYPGGIFQNEDVNLLDKNYAAADVLVHQAHTFFDPGDVIKAVPLSDIEEPNIYAKIGRMIPEQVGIRFSQLGYNMDLRDVITSPDANYLKPAPSNADPDFILTGSYIRRRSDLDIQLRIMQTDTARIIAAFNYSIPLSRQVAELAEPETRIMKLP